MNQEAQKSLRRTATKFVEEVGTKLTHLDMPSNYATVTQCLDSNMGDKISCPLEPLWETDTSGDLEPVTVSLTHREVGFGLSSPF